MKMVFQPDAEAVRHHDHRLVGKAHPLGQRRPVSANQVAGFVNGEADAWAKRIEDALNAQTAAPQGQTDTRKESLTNDDVGRLCVAPHQLKSAGIDQVLGALRAGGSITKLASSFYSGGYSYTHVLTTKRGTQYRVSKQVMRWVPDTVIPGQAQP